MSIDTDATHILTSEQDSKELAAQLSNEIKPNDVITFTGDLGVGKTFLCRQIIKNLCGQQTKVISPTFNLLQTYDYKDCLIYHFDLYRLNHPSEIYELGIEEAFAGNICLIEWPSIINNILPKNTIRINIEITSDKKRKLLIRRC